MTTLPGRTPRDLKTLVSNPLALVIALLLMGGAVTVIAAFPRESRLGTPVAAQLPPVSDEDRAKLAQWWELQPVVTVPVPSDGAKVVVVKFNDYQCPACKATHEMYKPVFAKYDPSQVRYVIKHYPLESECNPGVNAGHYASCEAAAGMVLARAKGTASKLEEWIWANLGPPALTPAQMREGVRTVGGIADFDAQYARALEEVKTDAGLGQLLHVNSTPTFFINGRKLPSILQPQFLDVIIDLELKRAQ